MNICDWGVGVGAHERGIMDRKSWAFGQSGLEGMWELYNVFGQVVPVRYGIWEE